LTIGLNGTTANNIVATVAATAGLVLNLAPTGTALGKLTADTQVYVKFTQTGTAATTGNATFIIKYAGVVS
jgi:ribulose-5-phosphate 4-epimerase/fuculose-1-phosphate aldolase